MKTSWDESIRLEVALNDPEDFLKVKETLTRIGIAASNNTLYQSCHILHKQGRYFIVHFKELFILDGKHSTLTDEDILRRNVIAILLSDWGLVSLCENVKHETSAEVMKTIKVIPFRDKHKWNLVPKYTIGKK